MTDSHLMDADCVHGVAWYECDVCVSDAPRPTTFEVVLAALKVDIVDHFTIYVDAIDVMLSENQVRVWVLDRLLPDADVWGHGQSGTEGSLAQCLAGIASCYIPNRGPS